MSKPTPRPLRSPVATRRRIALAPVLALAATAAAALFPASAAATEPSYFRSDHGAPANQNRALPADLGAPGALRWRTPVDPGHSTPVAAEGRLFFTTYRESTRELATEALDAATGRKLWRRVAPATQIEEFHRSAGGAAQPSPASDGRHVFSFFGSHGLLCYDLEGKLLWEKRLGPFRDEYGAGSSPMLVAGKVILQQDHDIDSFLLALDSETGAEVWRAARPDAVRSYSTPVPWNHGGQQELLVAGALELAAYDPATGRKKWFVNGLARIVIPVPVPVGDRIYVASWAPGGDSGRRITLPTWTVAVERWDADHDGHLTRVEVKDADVLDRFFRMDLDQSGALNETEWNRHAAVFQRAQNAVLALKPSSRQGELSDGDLLWKYQRGVPYVASPVVDSAALWMVKDGGIVTKLNLADGKPEFEERLPGVGNYHASPVLGDGKLYFASDPGVVSIVTNRGPWRVLSSHDFKERIRATPVIADGRLYLRTDAAIYAYGAGTK